MLNKYNCEIIKELLPNYIEKLTSKEVNSIIESHLEECKECNEIYENMNKNFEKEKSQIKKEVKYAKKYNRKLKLLFFIIISLLIIMFSATFLRNAIIIKDLSNKAGNYTNEDNFHIIWSTYSKEEITILDIYYKEGKYLEKMYSFNYDFFNTKEDIISEATFYYDGKSDKRLTFFEKEKILSYENVIGNEFLKNPTIKPENMTQITLFEENFIDFIKACFTNQISKEKANNINCYRFNNISNDFNALYIDTTTGLTIRSQSGIEYQENYSDTFSDIIYEFDTVTDEDFNIPNINEYIIQQ